MKRIYLWTIGLIGLWPGIALAQTTQPAAELPLSLKVQLASITGIVILTGGIVQVLKRFLRDVPTIKDVPLWAYAAAVAASLVLIARFGFGLLPGDLIDQLWQAVLAAGSAAGFYSWVHQLGASPSSSG